MTDLLARVRAAQVAAGEQAVIADLQAKGLIPAPEPTLTVTRSQLGAAFLEWETKHRAGETRPVEEVRSLPAEQVASECTETLWNLLKGE